MNRNSAPRVKLASTTPGRLRLRIDAPRGQGRLGRLAEELERMPETRRVRANHAARSVAVRYDPSQASALSLLTRLEQLGLGVMDLADPSEWPELLVERVVPMARDPQSVPGQLNQRLRIATAGALDLFQLTVAVLVMSAGLQLRGALLRGQPVPWLRVLAYLLTAASIWTRHRQGEAEG
jgi:hypothetical protein